jgi:hypothetical protein
MYIHLWHVSCRTRWARLCARLHKASKTATLKWLDPMTSEGINWINPTFLESVEQIFADELVTNHQLGLCAARINFGHLWAFYSATPTCGDMAWESYDTMCPYVIMVCLEKLKAVAPGSTTKIKIHPGCSWDVHIPHLLNGRSQLTSLTVFDSLLWRNTSTSPHARLYILLWDII